MKAKVVNVVENPFSKNTLVVSKCGTKIIICTKEINELTFNGIVIHDMNPLSIGTHDTFLKSAYSFFIGEITLSN